MVITASWWVGLVWFGLVCWNGGMDGERVRKFHDVVWFVCDVPMFTYVDAYRR